MSLDVAATLCAAAGGPRADARSCACPSASTGRSVGCSTAARTGIVAPRIETVDEARDGQPCLPLPADGQRSQLASVPQLGMRPTPAAGSIPLLERRPSCRS